MLDAETQVASMAAAVSQLELALRESQGPVLELGQALEKLNLGFARLRDSTETGAVEAELSAEVRHLSRELSTCIECTQFYDRMVQHLRSLQDFMSGIVAALNASEAGDHDAATWEHLRSTLRRRLISEAQRDLLDLILPPPGQQRSASAEARRLHVGEGSIELF